MVNGLQRDLKSVSTDHALPEATLPSDLEPLAIDYMVAGSRLGTNILRKSWAAAVNPLVLQADGYFGLPIDPSLWQETCQALAVVPTNSSHADAITADTRILFQLFASVLETLTSDQDVFV